MVRNDLFSCTIVVVTRTAIPNPCNNNNNNNKMRLTLKTPSKNHQLLKYIIHGNAAVDDRVWVLYRW